jgi:polyhydroxybutyrate depolymerase
VPTTLRSLAIAAGILLSLASARPAYAACDGDTSALGPTTLDVGGVSRLFVVRKASGVDGRTPAPVVMVFHPYGMTAQYMEGRVSTRLWPGAIMVYPEGATGPSRGYAPSWQGRAGESGDRDLTFFDAMLEWLMQHHCIDAKRVFAFGYSNGAGLAALLACERGDQIAGVAIASGRFTCTPKSPKPVAITHGLTDASIPYDEGVRSALAWTKQNACKAPPKSGAPGCFEATGCGAARVLMCTSPGGHEYSSAFTKPAIEMFQKAASRR